jgi:hypothetical protein
LLAETTRLDPGRARYQSPLKPAKAPSAADWTRPSASVTPRQPMAPPVSWSATSAPATGAPSETRVTQTAPLVTPSRAWTARSVSWPSTVSGCLREPFGSRSSSW